MRLVHDWVLLIFPRDIFLTVCRKKPKVSRLPSTVSEEAYWLENNIMVNCRHILKEAILDVKLSGISRRLQTFCALVNIIWKPPARPQGEN